MTLFVIGCLALLALAALFLLWPSRRNRPAVQGDANLQWYQLRRAELAQEDAPDLLDDARLRLLQDSPEDTEPENAETGRFFAILLLPAIIIAAAFGYWSLGAAVDVNISQRLDALDENTPRPQIEQLMVDIAGRSASRPDNLGYLALLGRYRMAQEDYAEAARVYLSLVDQAPGDSQAMALAAQAQFLAAGRQLTPDIQRLAEQALAVNPRQATALGLLGMAAFEREQYRAAIQYWERLAALEPPGSPSAQMLQDVIASARARLGEEAPVASVDTDAAPGISVTVTAPDGVLSGTETVFVLARRDGASSRMPIAVRRLSASELPITVRLDDTNSMAGQKLSEAGLVRVFVQVSATGQPGLDNAMLSGTVGPVSVSSDPADTVSIALSPVSG